MSTMFTLPAMPTTRTATAPFPPSLFFHWQSSPHCALFAGCGSVLQLIPSIGPYLASLALGTLEIDVPEGVFLVDRESIFIGKGTRIEPGAYIQGPCWIGENCTIRHGAYIRGNCIAEEGSVIGHATEVKNAYFFPKAHAAHFAYVGDSVLGHSVNLGAGVKLANVRFDKKEIVIPYEGKKYPTGLYKWGAILGDRCQIGCNAVTNPGTLIGPDVHCSPCEWIKGVRLSNHANAHLSDHVKEHHFP